MSIPHHILGTQQGLSILIQRLEHELGAELQDRVRDSCKTFMRYRRGRGASARDHIMQFESLYQAACDHGMGLSVPMLSMLLIETAGLTTSQEEWVLQCVGGDWSRYAQLRVALRRLPSLDSRHNQDAHAWPVMPAPPEPEPYQEERNTTGLARSIMVRSH